MYVYLCIFVSVLSEVCLSLELLLHNIINTIKIQSNTQMPSHALITDEKGLSISYSSSQELILSFFTFLLAYISCTGAFIVTFTYMLTVYLN
jgi:hypothetical protein